MNTNVSELHPAEPSSDLHLSNKEHNSKPLEDLYAGENIHSVQPEELWSPTILIEEDNVELNEYDHDIEGEDFQTLNSIYDEHMKLFLEEQMKDGEEVKRDLMQEEARTEVFNRCNKDCEDDGKCPFMKHTY